MKYRHLLAQGQRRTLNIQDPAAVYRGELPAEQSVVAVAAPSAPPPPPAQQFTGSLTSSQLNELAPWLLAVALSSNGNTDLAGGYLACDIVKIHDSDDSHELSIIWNESEATANRILNLVMGGANRTITLSGNPTLADWFDQALKKASAPTFDDLKLYDTNASHVVTLHWNEDDTGNRTLNILVHGADRTLDLNESLTIGNGHSGTITFSAASIVLTIDESETLSNYHTDARAATWLAAGHETTYNHGNYDTAYNWGDHAGVYELVGISVLEADFDAGTFLYATSNNTPQPKTSSEVMGILAPHIVCHNNQVVCHENEVVFN